VARERLTVKVKKTFHLRLDETEARALQAFYDMASRMAGERLPDGQSLLDGERQGIVNEIFHDLELELRR
jgi:hypothetical protein